jgi:hypothetical protein
VSHEQGDTNDVAPPGSAGWTIPEHHHSHAGLVELLNHDRQDGPVPALDAVVVPAARTADHLVSSARAARDLGAWFVVLASHDTDAALAHRIAVRFGPGAGRSAVVAVPVSWSTRDWSSRVHLMADRSPAVARRASNTAAKRNAGVALAVMCGWNRILFLDDDVHGMSRTGARRIAAALADGTDWEAAGYACKDFPDNSVLCHAVALSGGRQDQFIGGGALAIRVSDSTPHFPHVYNEDWLFMLPMLARRRRSIVLAGSLIQDPFDPFADVTAGVRQEWGDVLAEGLFHLLHGDMDLCETQTTAYWREMLHRRHALHRRVCRILESRPPDPRTAKVLELLRRAAAARSDADGWARELSRWVRCWRRDAELWADHLSALPKGIPVDEALHRLGTRRHLTPLDLTRLGPFTGSGASVGRDDDVLAWTGRASRLVVA